jgi:predicted nucleic acid-binding protein
MFLLDTNVVSELRKIRSGKSDRNVSAWADSVDAADLFVSVVTILELEIGILRVERRDPASGALLREWMNERVLSAFANRTLAADIAIAKRSAQLHVPDPRPIPDALIAGTALVHGMTLVTRNVADFAPMGVTVINPWN